MPLITINPNTCNHDGLCVAACPAGILRLGADRLPEVAPGAAERCIRCGHCVTVCPRDALRHAALPRETFLPVPSRRPGADEMENLLLSRRSVRAFRREPVPRAQLERLVETARRAPTASNSQNVSWVIVQDPDRLERVRELSLQWMDSDGRRPHHVEAAKKGRDVILRGGTALAVAHAPAAYAWTDVDCAIALTYMELLASAMGFGACWGGLVTLAAAAIPALPEVLGVPAENRVGGALMLGLSRQRHYLIPPRNAARVAWL